MEWITRSGAHCVGTLSLLLFAGVAAAAAPTDVSQLDLTTARQTVTVTARPSLTSVPRSWPARLQRTARKNARSLGAIRSRNRRPLNVP